MNKNFNQAKGKDADKKKKRSEMTEEDKELEQIKKNIVEREQSLTNWVPKTELGRAVKAGKITTLEEIFDKGLKILEPEIVDTLVALEDEVVELARTTRVTMAGRKYSYRASVVVGNKDGFIGIGSGKDADRFPAINKAKKAAKLALIRVYRGSGSWQEQKTDDKHSVPLKVTGQCGSVRVTLIPAPKGTGLAVGKSIKRVLELAGVKNVWSKAAGRTAIPLNFVKAAIDALDKVAQMKMSKDIERKISK
jgi:small subunit ribosomal protein S5